MKDKTRVWRGIVGVLIALMGIVAIYVFHAPIWSALALIGAGVAMLAAALLTGDNV